MSDLIIEINKKTRKVKLNNIHIGNDHENLQENLVFQFDEFVDGQARLEYEINETKNYIILQKENETYTIPVQNVITIYQEQTKGKINFQLVVTEGTEEENIPVFKSNIFFLICRPSINAVTEAPEGYDLWIEQANAKLNAMDEALKEVDNLDIEATKVGDTATITITKKDGTTQSVNITDGQNGQDGKDGVDGKDAEINGKNSIEIEAGNNITIEDTETGIRINSTGGGSGGTSNYNNLSNKPKINNVELNGNKSLNDLGIQPKGDYLTTETDPTVPNYVKSITQQNITNWNNKADMSDIPDVSNFITRNVNNLVNYYLKSEAYTKTEINNLIGQIATLQFQVVNELPQTGDSKYIYLVPSTNPKTQNVKDEYIWTNNSWEQIGSTQVDLTGYATESWVNTQISGFLTQAQIQSLITTALTGYALESDIPTNLSDLTDDSTHRLVTDVEKNNWNAKYDKPVGGIPKTDLDISEATTSVSGLMSSTDKSKLNGIEEGAEVNVQSDWEEENSNSKAYIQNKPIIPSVNNGTLTISKNSNAIGTFSANASTDKTINITVPTDTSDLTNGAGYTTNIGTITSVKMNGTTISSDGEANLGTVITEHQDITGKEDKNNKTTTVDENSTDIQYPSAKLFYNTTTNLEAKYENLKNDHPLINETNTNLSIQGTGNFDLELNLKGNITQETTTGKQLFNKNSEISVNLSNQVIEVLDTGVKVKYIGGSSAATNFVVYVIQDLTNYTGQTVRFKCNFTSSAENNGRYYIGLCNSSGGNRTAKATASASGTELSFVVPEFTDSNTYLCVALYSNYNGAFNTNDYIDYTNVICTINNADLSYEKYTNGVATPNHLFTSPIKKVDGEYSITISNSDNTQSRSKTIDTSPNPLYGEDDYYYKNNDEWFVYNKFSIQDFESGVSSVNINSMKSNGQFYSTAGGTISGTTITFSGTTTVSGNIVYELATPTNTKITNTNLINSLEELQNLTAYQNQTNISQTHNSAQSDIKINAKTIMSLKYMQQEIENLSSRLALLE